MKENYIETQREIMDVCRMVINNAYVFPLDQIAKAEKLLAEAQENVRLHEECLRGTIWFI